MEEQRGATNQFNYSTGVVENVDRDRKFYRNAILVLLAHDFVNV